MSNVVPVALRVSVVLLIVCVAYRDLLRGRPRKFFLTAFFCAVGLVVFSLTATDEIQSKGTVEDVVGLVLGFLTTILGMTAEYFYRQTQQRRKKFKFDFVTFASPILVSPVVFMPLFTMFADIDFGGPFTRAKFMIYLVAFQNGFFWRHFFEERQKTSGQGVFSSSIVEKPKELSRAAKAGVSR